MTNAGRFLYQALQEAFVLTIKQEGMEKWGVLKHGYYASGAGTYEDPYQVYIHERDASVSGDLAVGEEYQNC